MRRQASQSDALWTYPHTCVPVPRPQGTHWIVRSFPAAGGCAVLDESDVAAQDQGQGHSVRMCRACLL